MAIMYDDNKKVFVCQNSWGSSWGDNGFLYLPYDYILNSELCSDFWLITSFELYNDTIG